MTKRSQLYRGKREQLVQGPQGWNEHWVQEAGSGEGTWWEMRSET